VSLQATLSYSSLVSANVLQAHRPGGGD